ncbi:MAG: hypothetical protein WC832_06705 [Anaerolineales bacterium]
MTCIYCQAGVPWDYKHGRPAHHINTTNELAPCADRIKKYDFVIRPALEFAHKMDIGINPDPAALYDGRGGCINFWCTPADNPGGRWTEYQMLAGAHCKAGDFVGTVTWELDDDRNVVKLLIDSSAYALRDNFPEAFTELKRYQQLARRAGRKVELIYNRRPDLAWVRLKTRLLFRSAGVNLQAAGIPIVIKKEQP